MQKTRTANEAIFYEAPKEYCFCCYNLKIIIYRQNTLNSTKICTYNKCVMFTNLNKLKYWTIINPVKELKTNDSKTPTSKPF